MMIDADSRIRFQTQIFHQIIINILIMGDTAEIHALKAFLILYLAQSHLSAPCYFIRQYILLYNVYVKKREVVVIFVYILS